MTATLDPTVTCDRSDHDHTSLEGARTCARVAAQIAEAEDRLMNAAATSRALAEAVVALSVLTNSGDAELDAIAATLQTKLDAAIATRTAASAALKALRS